MASSGPPTTTLNHATQTTAKNESHRILFTRIGISQVYPSLFIQLGGVFGGIVGFGEFYFGPGEAVYWTLGQCPQCLDCLDIFGLEFAAPTSMPAPGTERVRT